MWGDEMLVSQPGQSTACSEYGRTKPCISDCVIIGPFLNGEMAAACKGLILLNTTPLRLGARLSAGKAICKRECTATHDGTCVLSGATFIVEPPRLQRGMLRPGTSS